MHASDLIRPAALLLAGLTLGALPSAAQEASTKKSFPDQYQETWEQSGPNVRIKRHQDGSRTVFQRSPNDRILVKKRYSGDKTDNLRLVTVYWLDQHGNERACKIWDGKKNLLFKVAYAYNQHTGRLEAERMYDARTERFDVNDTSKEAPVRVMYYNYDAQGNPTAPEVYTFKEGQLAEEVFGQGTYPHDNPFKGER